MCLPARGALPFLNKAVTAAPSPTLSSNSFLLNPVMIHFAPDIKKKNKRPLRLEGPHHALFITSTQKKANSANPISVEFDL